MKIELSLIMKICVFCSIIYSSIMSAPATASAIKEFELKTGKGVTGEINWPGGEFSAWSGNIIILVGSLAYSDRDGWSLSTPSSTWADRLPKKELADSLVKSGNMVARFENPGVRSTIKQCRSIANQSLPNQIGLAKYCVDEFASKQVTQDDMLDSIDAVVNYLKMTVPKGANKIVLFGMSEGIAHIAKIIDDRRISVAAVVAVGSPPMPLKDVTRWQFVDRVVDSVFMLDKEKRGFVSNDEVIKAFERKEIDFMSFSETLLNLKDGRWDDGNIIILRKRLEFNYERALSTIKNKSIGTENGFLPNGAEIPLFPSSLIELHFFDDLDPVKVLKDKNIPSIWFFGGLDKQINVEESRFLLSKDINLKTQFRLYTDRHHLLSKSADLDWMEIEFMRFVSQDVTAFIGQTLK